ncbi:MAG: transaldolase family protein, partial [Steroidobacteraceae bacterium]
VPPQLRNRLGIAIAYRTHAAHRELLASARWQDLAGKGARPQRLLWASTGTKEPSASDTLYVEALALSGTINTLPEKTLLAFADHGRPSLADVAAMAAAEATLTSFEQYGVDLQALAQRLQDDGTQLFVKSWKQLLQRIATKRLALAGGVAGQ